MKSRSQPREGCGTISSMFTGIVRHLGRVTAVKRSGASAELRIDLGPLRAGLALGDSVAVNGLCLTASRIEGEAAVFDVVAESLSRSTLGELRVGDKANLERALPADGRLDGHIVQGHIDGIAVVRHVQRGENWRIEFAGPRDLCRQLVPKGSVAIDGVSLTVVDAEEERFSVAVIPTTLADTTLAELSPGRRVNIEADILGKYVRAHLRDMLSEDTTSSGVTLETLRRAGFV